MSTKLPTAAYPRRVHLIGVAGVGMAALAGLLRSAGCEVSGSDENIYAPMSEKLREWGIEVRAPFSEANLTPVPDLVVVSAAITPGHIEVQAARRLGLVPTSLPEALASLLLQGRRQVVVVGTHGKTTSSSLLAWTLDRAGREPGFFIGGIPKNFGVGSRIGGASAETPWVIEGDEYRTSSADDRPKFLHFGPEVLLCTNLEFDHANLYHGIDPIIDRFSQLMELVPDRGRIVCCAEAPGLRRALRRSAALAEVLTYGRGGQWTAEEVGQSPEGLTFTPAFQGKWTSGPVTVALHGRHNLLNSLGCYAVLETMGLSHREIADGFSTFEGVVRRMDVVGEEAGVLVLDDFAHHPTEVAAALEAARCRFPDRGLWAVFEPRSITSCRGIFQREYAEAFDAADRVLLAPPFRDPVADDRLDVERLAADIGARGPGAAAFPSIDAIVEAVRREAPARVMVLCMSSGSFGGIQGRLIDVLRDRPAPTPENR